MSSLPSWVKPLDTADTNNRNIIIDEPPKVEKPIVQSNAEVPAWVKPLDNNSVELDDKEPQEEKGYLDRVGKNISERAEKYGDYYGTLKEEGLAEKSMKVASWPIIIAGNVVGAGAEAAVIEPIISGYKTIAGTDIGKNIGEFAKEKTGIAKELLSEDPIIKYVKEAGSDFLKTEAGKYIIGAVKKDINKVKDIYTNNPDLMYFASNALELFGFGLGGKASKELAKKAGPPLLKGAKGVIGEGKALTKDLGNVISPRTIERLDNNISKITKNDFAKAISPTGKIFNTPKGTEKFYNSVKNSTESIINNKMNLNLNKEKMFNRVKKVDIPEDLGTYIDSIEQTTKTIIDKLKIAQDKVGDIQIDLNPIKRALEKEKERLSRSTAKGARTTMAVIDRRIADLETQGMKSFFNDAISDLTSTNSILNAYLLAPDPNKLGAAGVEEIYRYNLRKQIIESAKSAGDTKIDGLRRELGDLLAIRDKVARAAHKELKAKNATFEDLLVNEAATAQIAYAMTHNPALLTAAVGTKVIKGVHTARNSSSRIIKDMFKDVEANMVKRTKLELGEYNSKMLNVAKNKLNGLSNKIKNGLPKNIKIAPGKEDQALQTLINLANSVEDVPTFLRQGKKLKHLSPPKPPVEAPKYGKTAIEANTVYQRALQIVQSPIGLKMLNERLAREELLSNVISKSAPSTKNILPPGGLGKEQFIDIDKIRMADKFAKNTGLNRLGRQKGIIGGGTVSGQELLRLKQLGAVSQGKEVPFSRLRK